MVELRIERGSQTGTVVQVTQFPFSLGRGKVDLVLNDPGVWDQHCRLVFPETGSVLLEPQDGVPVYVRGEVVTEAVGLRQGDVLEVGEARLQFRLSPTRQRGLRLRETAAWVLLGGLLLLQVALALAW